jgi:agmatine deiminase
VEARRRAAGGGDPGRLRNPTIDAAAIAIRPSVRVGVTLAPGGDRRAAMSGFRCWGAFALCLLPMLVSAQPLVPQAVLDAIVDDDAQALPRSLTPQERATWRLPSRLPAAPPTVPVRAQAEYESNDGLLIRWGTQNALLTEMTVAVTTLTPDARMFVVVSSTAQQASATSTLQAAGADLSQVSFIVAPTNSVWIRDYGPRFVDASGSRAMVDHVYNRPRPLDDALPVALAQQWNEARYELPLVHGGGNFHLFANRRAFMTELILAENPGTSAQQVRDLYQQYQGLDLTLVTPFPSSFDATQHIDMWLLPVDDDELIVSDYPASAGSPATIADAFAAAREAEGLIVHRTPGWSAGGSHYTYANAVVINEIVLVCRFNGYPTENAAALATFQAAYEDRTVVSVDCSSIISLAGAIHCIVMHVPRIDVGVLLRDGFEPVVVR